MWQLSAQKLSCLSSNSLTCGAVMRDSPSDTQGTKEDPSLHKDDSFIIIDDYRTLVYRIDVHARLLILRKKSPLHGLILVCTFIVFEKKFPSARLFHPARLVILVCSKFLSWSSTKLLCGKRQFYHFEWVCTTFTYVICTWSICTY